MLEMKKQSKIQQRTMNRHVLTSILIALTLNSDLTGIAAEFISFKIALKNDLNATCVEKKGFNINTATAAAEDCITAALEDLYERRSEINHNEERINLICTTDITNECNDKFKDVVLPCLPEGAQEVVVKMTEVQYQGVLSLCANDAKNYKALLETTCEKKTELNNMIAECGYELFQDESRHLITYFSTDNCRKSEEYYQCVKNIDVGCPDMQSAITGVYHALSEASPCAKHKTLKWMDFMS